MGVAVGRIAGGDGDVAAGSDDAVEGAAIDDQILDHREGGRAPGLDDQLFSVFEVAHGQLADGGGALGPWATPLIMKPQEPQMPSRQSCSKATGSSPFSISSR
jgi:hypothetical protein